jgi:hypothetical protein
MGFEHLIVLFGSIFLFLRGAPHARCVCMLAGAMVSGLVDLETIHCSSDPKMSQQNAGV